MAAALQSSMFSLSLSSNSFLGQRFPLHPTPPVSYVFNVLSIFSCILLAAVFQLHPQIVNSKQFKKTKLDIKLATLSAFLSWIWKPHMIQLLRNPDFLVTNLLLVSWNLFSIFTSVGRWWFLFVSLSVDNIYYCWSLLFINLQVKTTDKPCPIVMKVCHLLVFLTNRLCVLPLKPVVW